MVHWSWWLSGLALAAVPIAHWLLLGRSVAVSGRYTALIDRLRHGKASDEGEDLDQAALLDALRAQTALALGEDALEDAPATVDDAPAVRAPQGSLSHVLFLGGLLLGGVISALLAGELGLHAGLRGETFAAVVDRLGVPAPALLLFGGACVGFGTRMAGGCTSGHGLCGVSQLQAGSLLATAAFFGAGVATSFALGALL
jgi:uncharacterized membrane protein YedE/YeeE